MHYAATLSSEQIAYAALDAVVVLKLHQIQLEALAKENRNLVYALMRDAQKAIAKLELNGIYFDATAHAALMERWKIEKEAAEVELRKTIGSAINPNSSKQLSKWFRENLDGNLLLDWPRTEKGQLKTDKNTLVLFSDHPLVQPLLKYKECSTRLSTYGENFRSHIHPITGRIHPNLRLGKAKTGRMSCESPNLQNSPREREYRALFCSPPGRVLVIADYGQIELRVAALVSGDRAMLEAYALGVDLHRKTAAAIARIPLDQVTKEQRQAAKAVNFGLLYGQGAEGLARYAKITYGVNMTLEEAEKARNAFFATYPDLWKWQRRSSTRAEQEMKVTTPGGRVRDFRKESKGYRYTESLNTPIQGGAAEVLLAALARLDRSIEEEKIDAKLVNVVHDEIILEVVEADADRAKKLLETAMVKGMQEVFPNACTKDLVEAHIGKNWAEAKS